MNKTALRNQDTQFHSGVYDASEMMEAWTYEPARTSNLAFYIGRNKQYAGERGEALKWYAEAAVRAPAFPWIFYERSEIHEQAGDIPELAADLLTFLKLLEDNKLESQLNSEHHKAILRKGHLVFTRDVPLSRRVYSAASALKIFDYLSLLRIIEGLLDHGSVSEADELATVLMERFTPDAFGVLALSRLLQGKNQIAEAVEQVRRAGDMMPAHLWLRGRVCVRLIELGDLTKAKAAIDFFATDPRLDIEDVSCRLPALQFRLAVHQRDVRGALAVGQDLDLDWSCIENWVYAEAVYIFARHGHVWTPDESTLLQILRDYLFERFDSDASACLAVLHYHTAKGEWMQASRLIDLVRQKPIFESRDMVIVRFDVACHMQDLAEAQRIYATRWRDNASLNLSELALSMRMLSELKDWQGAADVAADLLVRGMSLPEDIYGMLLVIRRAGQHRRFVDMIERIGRTDPFARGLEELLVDDLCILHGALKLPEASRPHQVSRGNSILIKAPDTVRRKPAELAGFICSDRAYFVSVLTLIASLAPNVRRDADWYVFLSADVPEPWVAMLGDFCARLNFDVTIVPEAEFLASSEGCPTGYGLFSGGRNLARSAYFRIYAAGWLLRKNLYVRAVYMDSDIICQTDLDSLFSLDLGDSPLAARPEEYGVAVLKAALKCGVAPEDYINSGVLVFNFEHPALAQRLQDAIWQAENGGDRLTFHDQCALNIAFAGAIRRLPEQFNTFLRPSRTYDEELRSGVLLHYLDRPKPWDTGFKPSHRLPWMMAAAVVKALVPQDVYREVVAAGIGQAALLSLTTKGVN